MMTTLNILVVDDSVTTRSFIKRIIKVSGMSIGLLLEASNGKQALDILQAQPVTLVLADLNMPIMGGIEMITLMRQQDRLRQTPVVVISAQPDPEVIEKLKLLGVTNYLAKPFSPERVRDILESELMGTANGADEEVTQRYESVDRLLARALAEALETMAFMGTEQPETTEPGGSGDLHRARVDFAGQAYRGSFTLTASSQFGAAVAENCAVADAFENADDALKELTNIACGVFLRSRAGGAAGVRLEPPVLETGGDVVPDGPGRHQVTVLADGFMVWAELEADAASAEMWK